MAAANTEKEMQTRLRQQEVLAELGQRALESDDLHGLMQQTTAAVSEQLGVEYCKVLELLPDGEGVFLQAGVGWRDGLVGNATVPTERDSQAGYTLLSAEPVVVEDLRTEERFSGPDLLVDHGVVSGISVLIGTVEDPWGVLGAHTTDRRAFSEHDVHFVQSVANVLASAIENAEARRHARAEEELTERIVETSPVGIMVVGADGELRFANERAEEIFGRSKDEIVDLAYNDADWGEVDVDGNPITDEDQPFTRIVETGAPLFDHVSSIDRPDGERVWISVSGVPMFDESGAIDGVVFAINDVTEKHRLRTQNAEILDRITDAFYALDDEYRFTHVNERAAELLQRPREQLLGESLWELYPAAAEVEDVWDSFHTALEEQESTSYELYFEPLDFWVESSIYPSETGLSVYFRDVTERVERERELAWFERAVEASGHGIYMTDTDGAITYVNPAFEEITGYAASEVVGRQPSVLSSGEHDEAYYRNLWETVLDGDVWEEEIVDRRKSGERYYAEQTIAPVTDENGVIDRFVAVQTDVTDRKVRERELEQTTSRYRTLIDHFPNGAVALFDEELHYTLAGGELFEDLETSREEVIGSSILERYPEDVLEEIEPIFRATFEGESSTFEVNVRDRHWHAHAVPVQNGDGEVFAGMVMVQDVSERERSRRRLEEVVTALEASNERLEQFAYAASHDLQEPLRMISSYLQLLERRHGDDLEEDALEFLEFAVDGADRMRRMIDGLLAYSRVDSRGKSFESVDLETVLAEVIDDLSVKIAESDARVDAGSMPTVRGDASQLRQVLQNLLDNAIEYGSEDPHVRIDAELEGGEWIVSVSDDGIGIRPEDRERIFQVFQRLHAVDEHDGSGIGLALCQRIVERHGGRIWVDSEVGGGSTFSVSLPAEDAECEPAEPGAREDSPTVISTGDESEEVLGDRRRNRSSTSESTTAKDQSAADDRTTANRQSTADDRSTPDKGATAEVSMGDRDE